MRWFFLILLLISTPLWAMPFDSGEGYQKLEKALHTYEKMQNKEAWPVIAFGEKIKLGARDPRIPILRDRLIAEKYLNSASIKDEDKDLFDSDLDGALKKFQATHGLLVDGELGKNTIISLNVPLEKRLCQIKINLDRMSTSQLGWENRYLVVNIPEFMLRVYEGKNIPIEMRVITGQRTKQTPLFDDVMEYVVINPTWDVPHKIAVEEELRHVQKDPEYFTKKGMKLIAKTDEGKVEVDPSTIDWSVVTKKEFNYHIVQQPGLDNALGTIKFIFPNENDVYLHDTPNHSLFSRADRALSHGCVRVSEPVTLAEYVLKNQPGDWTTEKIKKTITTATIKTIPLANKLPVYLVYFTSWVDDAGDLHLRDDLYKKDAETAAMVCGE